ncbi:MAG: dihydroorotate dehydrogenase-like protein [Bacteroidales bacterium]|nr:dihydroorotate dehydrogenase-like protein [Bacteroidales bacterium]
MVDLTTTYAGLNLANPLIVSSSGLSDSVVKIERLAGYGPGAIVLKSLFEEQIMAEAGKLMDGHDYPEASDYIRNYTKDHSVGEYLKLISSAKSKIGIPLIASINCLTSTDWIGFARQIEEAGADALELNMFLLPIDGSDPRKIEQVYLDLIQRVKGKTNLPLIIKISPYFSNLIHLVQQFHAVGASAVVMFNRLYEPDIDVEALKITHAEVFSNSSDLRHTLRWIGLISDPLRKIDLSASTGVHDSEAVIKLLLAGAQTVQVCSVLYRNGPQYIEDLVGGLTRWMEEKKYSKIDQFRGKMSYRSIENPRTWERSQFMRYFSNYH